MEREIKFRAWNEDYKLMSKPFTFGQILNFNDKHIKSLTNEIVTQYTGLKDKNGVEIYEGDILKVQDFYSKFWSKNGAEVIFSSDYVGGWVISNGNQNLTLGKRQNEILVIGNIHENPELLKDE